MARPTVCAIFAGLLMFALAPQVRAGDGCSVADLKGDYSFVLSGTVVGANAPGLPTGPFAAAGETIYNGDGTADGVIQVSLNATQGQLYSKWDRNLYTRDYFVTLHLCVHQSYHSHGNRHNGDLLYYRWRRFQGAAFCRD
jgi:hypothetical protein